MDFASGAEEMRKMHCNCERCQRGSQDNARESENSEQSKEKLSLAILSPAKGSESEALSKEIEQFEKKTALEVIQSANQLEYKISIHGKDQILHKSDASAKGLEEAEKKITELVQAKQKEIAKTFNVSFSSAGDDVTRQWVQKPDCSWERGIMVKARNPNLIELYGIESALNRCTPSNITVKGQGVKFHFLESNYYKDQPVLAYYTSGDKDGNPSIYFEPGANKNKPATELDSERFGRDFLFSVEALTSHELSHVHQAKNGWYTPAEKEKLAKSIGWLPILDKDGSTEFILKGKADGEFYRLGKDHCSDSKVWVKCDSNGEPLDDKGNKAGSFKQAKHYKRSDVQNRAEVKPLTYYFPNPTEMFAEGLMLFRLGTKNRAELLEQSPALYKAAKEQDQIEIDKKFGKDAASSSKFVRGIDGMLKENNESERKAIKEFEEGVLKKDKKPASKKQASEKQASEKQASEKQASEKQASEKQASAVLVSRHYLWIRQQAFSRV